MFEDNVSSAADRRAEVDKVSMKSHATHFEIYKTVVE
jgi:hypothetical protein